VYERDRDLVQACLAFTDPATLAVWCADLWIESEEDAAGLRDELGAERQLVADLRAENARLRAEAALYRSDPSAATVARLRVQVGVLKRKVQELRAAGEATAWKRSA
jgi:hypothetical protein